jgi:His-Xaa-Ser system protein HxsD
MAGILKEVVKGQEFELVIETQIFSKDIILKSAYNLLDKGYFFFRYDKDQNMILEFTAKSDIDTDPKIIIWEFSDELLDVYLRDTLEKDNKVIREAIVTKAINGPLDMQNFVSLDTDNYQSNEIDFDKDIDEILKEIENDPDLKIDEAEIEKILKEIEEETESISKPGITANSEGLKWAKDMFKKK